MGVNRAHHLIQLCEKFSSGMKTMSQEYFEIFENPSKKEFQECNVDYVVRWVADLKQKRIWCWNGEKSIHRHVIKRLIAENPADFRGIEGIIKDSPQAIIASSGFPNWISGHTENNASQTDIIDFIAMPDEVLYYDDATRALLTKKLLLLNQVDISWLERYVGNLRQLKQDIVDAYEYAADLK